MAAYLADQRMTPFLPFAHWSPAERAGVQTDRRNVVSSKPKNGFNFVSSDSERDAARNSRRREILQRTPACDESPMNRHERTRQCARQTGIVHTCAASQDCATCALAGVCCERRQQERGRCGPSAQAKPMLAGLPPPAGRPHLARIMPASPAPATGPGARPGN
jgi:hypothetical protein